MAASRITCRLEQDRAQVAEFFPKLGHDIHGVKSHSSWSITEQFDPPNHNAHANHSDFALHCGDFLCIDNLPGLVQKVQLASIGNIVAMRRVAVSF